MLRYVSFKLTGGGEYPGIFPAVDRKNDAVSVRAILSVIFDVRFELELLSSM